MSMCRVFSCVVGRGCLLWPLRSLGKTLISLCPASFCIPRPNLPVTPGVSWLPTFAFQVYAPTSNAEEAEVERFYEDLQDLLQLTPKKRCPLHYRGLECQSRKSIKKKFVHYKLNRWTSHFSFLYSFCNKIYFPYYKCDSFMVENIDKQQETKNHPLGENICKSYNWQSIYIQNI